MPSGNGFIIYDKPLTTGTQPDHIVQYDMALSTGVGATKSSRNPIKGIRYLNHDRWQERIDAVTIPFGPKERDVPFYRQLDGRPIFLVVHLFSGRRRHHDFHERLHQLVKGKPFDVHVLSLDTAIDKSYGNLAASSVTWARLYSLLRIGAIAAGLAGPPCETFSAARYYQPSEEELKQSNGRPWPRPLRDSMNPWGLEGLSIREVRHLSVGSAFALQTLVVLVWLLVQGGSFLVEHPAPSKDEWKVSLFRTTIAKLLRSLPEVQFEIFCQGDWGATSTKPTGILALRHPTIRTSMFRWRAPTPLDARETAIGKSNGEFRTKHLKEYPEPFAAGLAQCVADSLQRKHQKGATCACNPCADDMAWISTVLDVVTHVCEDGVMMPDSFHLRFWPSAAVIRCELRAWSSFAGKKKFCGWWVDSESMSNFMSHH